MHSDELLELEKQYQFGEPIDEEEYEKKFLYKEKDSSSTTSVVEDDPNSENIRNTFEFNNDTEKNPDIAQNFNNNENGIIIYQLREAFLDVYAEHP